LRADSKPYRCIVDAHARNEDWSKALAANATLLDRYRALPVTPQYVNLLSPDPLVPLLQWSGLIDGKRLFLTRLALQLDSGDVDGAIDGIATDTRRWRNILALRHLLLVDKMIAVAQLRLDLLFASELLRTKPTLEAAQYDALNSALSPLMPVERSMRGPAEAGIRIEGFALLKSKYYKNSLSPPHSDFLDYVLYVPFKIGSQPVATLNLFYKANEKMAAESEMACTSYPGFTDGLYKTLDIHPPDFLYNPNGRLHVGMDLSFYADYFARICDVQGMQRLVALQLNIRREALGDDQIPAYIGQAGSRYADPYSGQPMQWDAKSHGLSFAATDKRNRSGMPWPI
jgi:hypothetical protein